MIIDICEGEIYDFETGKAICCVDGIHHQKKEIIMMIINALIEEREDFKDKIDRLEDDLSTFEYKVERLEDELEMLEDNWGIEE